MQSCCVCVYLCNKISVGCESNLCICATIYIYTNIRICVSNRETLARMVERLLDVSSSPGWVIRIIVFHLKTDINFQSRTYFSMQTDFIDFVFWSRLSSERGEHELNRKFINFITALIPKL